ncbi:MAG: alginate lyase family protein, partial [Thermotogota bacterium]|nr:alginate lyase family protein [Thermotogota bacterium]
MNRSKFYPSVYCNPSDIISKCNRIYICALSEAREILKGRIKLLRTEPFVFSKKLNWLVDPVTKRKWRLFRGRPYLFAQKQYQDLKHNCELNRQQHLIVLGKVCFFSGDKTYETEIYSQIRSWIKSNPYRKTINWLSPLESSIRIISWLWAIYLVACGRIDHLKQNDYRAIIESIYEQTIHIEKNLQQREYPNNHLIGEAATLVIVGIMCPQFSEAGNWLDKGLDILGTQINNQVFSDGVDKEQALDYHRFVLDFYTHIVILCDRNNVSLHHQLLQRLEKMYEALLYMVRPDGFGPMIGDDDNGRVATLSSESGRFLLSALSTGAVLFKRGDFKFAAREFHEESLWLLGLDGYREFQEIEPEKPHSTSFYFPDTGLFVMRSEGDRESHYMSFDCGPQGMGTGGHSHSDTLSFELSAFGVPIMIDPGTFVYNGSSRWRDYFRGTSAHNTVVVDGLNQSEYIEPYDNFGWSKKADCKTTACFSDEEFDFIGGYHDGYKRLSDPVRHFRSVLFVKNEYWLITDILDGQGEHCLEWPLHFVQDITIQ